MKLTKYQKEAIVRAIMNDTPRKDEKTAKEEIQAALVKAMSPECRKLYKKTPKALRDARVSGYDYGFDYSFDVIKGDADIEPILAPYRAARDARNKARDQLYSAVMAHSTTKALLKALPEFEKYYPTEAQPAKNLPALANVMADLTKLGWPKDTKKENQNA
jgi:hypothetical protein